MAWSKESRHVRGYDARWDRLRIQVLRRDNYLCQCSHCQGGKLRVTPATEVHHITSKASAKRRGWSLARTDDPANLASMSHDCHEREDAQEQGRTLKPMVQIGVDGYPVTMDGGRSKG
jgi:5-methylcytosine-specific restriction enzyme A